ncbi:protoheme IX farnesyltransferase [Marinobacterium nitratireducens]|uniref:Protoheme IX farnesyltransferase n=1 Tax=Marinobacterium nitratireducens TaxID=518897 RepID=A0A917ZQ74_9GAMM|nr:heme o synthase [Marinobacterium nitratireducens]GGO88173.1 protoheme IX farnesyltransferase [Marinobacterium nitratireducens]
MPARKAVEFAHAPVTWRDYLELCKPRVVAVMLLTALVGMGLAQEGPPSLVLVILTMSGIALAAGSAAAVNHVMDRHIDQHMARTRGRPLPSGKLSAQQALAFAALIGVAGISLLAFWVNPLTAWLTLLSLIGYAVIYTVFLKRATPQNIVIGGVAGASPPLLGWTAVTGALEPNGLLLMLIIFAWTPPHFWALCIARREDYEKAGVPMLPVTHGEHFTRLQIMLYTLLMIATTALPFLAGMSGLIYLAGISVLNLRFLQWAWRVMRAGDDRRVPMQMFRYSIVYVMALFALLLVDHYLKFNL